MYLKVKVAYALTPTKNPFLLTSVKKYPSLFELNSSLTHKISQIALQRTEVYEPSEPFLMKKMSQIPILYLCSIAMKFLVVLCYLFSFV